MSSASWRCSCRRHAQSRCRSSAPYATKRHHFCPAALRVASVSVSQTCSSFLRRESTRRKAAAPSGVPITKGWMPMTTVVASRAGSARAGVGFLAIGQKHNTLAAREAAHIDPRFVVVGDLVEVEVLVLLRREVEIHLRALEALHVFVDVGRIDAMGKHEGDHELRVDDLAE